MKDARLNNESGIFFQKMCPKCDVFDNMYIITKERIKVMNTKKTSKKNTKKNEFWNEFKEILRSEEMRKWFFEYRKRNLTTPIDTIQKI